MKFMPRSRATRTARMASPRSMARNSAPSDDAPKLSQDRFRPVLPSGRVCTEGSFAAALWAGRWYLMEGWRARLVQCKERGMKQDASTLVERSHAEALARLRAQSATAAAGREP